jgi:hypothetical protein
MNMRNAFALVELLAAMMVIALISITMAALTRPLIIEIPRANHAITANTSVLNMLSRLRDDIEMAVRLPDSLAGGQSDARNLLIQLPDSNVCYTLEEDKVFRKVLNGKYSGKSYQVWSIPEAKINWRRWQRNDESYAVEVCTYIECGQDSRMKTKLANSHVYFVGASAEAVKK